MGYIDVENLSYSYSIGGKNILSNVNLSIDKGDIVLIMGESGSGKSTLLRSLTGSIPHFYGGEISGRVLYEGKSLSDMTQRERASKIAMVFQSPESQIIMDKVHKEVAFSLENIAVPEATIRRRVFEALQFLKLLPLAYEDTEKLSGGEKHKVVLASVLAMKTDVIILDEPTSQLDPQSSEEFINLLKKINQELGKTIIIVEQKIDYIYDIADKIVILEKGSVEFIGSKKEFYNRGYEGFLPMYLKIARQFDFTDVSDIRDMRRQLELYLRDKKPTNRMLCNSDITREVVLEVSNMNVKIDNKIILKDINLEFKQGKIYSILGENGAGKSTLLKAIMNLVKYSGSIKFKDKKLYKLKPSQIAHNIGYVSQNPNDYISKDTVYDEVKFTLDNFGIEDVSKVDNILKELGIFNIRNKNPRDISEGEKERVAIASILIMDTEIILLDEPSKGLDYTSKKVLGYILKDLKEKGKTIIMVSHDIDYVAEYSDDIVLLLNGEIIDRGRTEDILREGIYYTSTVNRLCNGAFTFKELCEYE